MLLGDLNCLCNSVILWGEGIRWASRLPGLLQTYYLAKMTLDSWSSQLHLSSSGTAGVLHHTHTYEVLGVEFKA